MTIRTRSRKAKDSPADFLRAQAVEFYDFALQLRKHRAVLLDDPRLATIGDMLRNAGELLYDVTVDIQLGRLRPAERTAPAALPLFDGAPTDARTMDDQRQAPPADALPRGPEGRPPGDAGILPSPAVVGDQGLPGGEGPAPVVDEDGVRPGPDRGIAGDVDRPDPAPRAEAGTNSISSDPSLECFDILNNGKPFDTIRAASDDSALAAARLKYPSKRKLSVRPWHPDPIGRGPEITPAEACREPQPAEATPGDPPKALPRFDVFEVLADGEVIDAIEATNPEAAMGVATARHGIDNLAIRLKGDDQVAATEEANPEPTAPPNPDVKVNTTWTGANDRFFVQVNYGCREFADFEFEYRGTMQGKALYIVHCPAFLGFDPDEIPVEEEIKHHVTTQTWAERVAVDLMTNQLLKLAGAAAEVVADAKGEAQVTPESTTPDLPPEPRRPDSYWRIYAPDTLPFLLRAKHIDDAENYAASLIPGFKDLPDSRRSITPVLADEVKGEAYVEVFGRNPNLTIRERQQYAAQRSPGALLMVEAIDRWLDSDRSRPQWGEWFEHQAVLDSGAYVTFIAKPQPGAHDDTIALTVRGPVSSTGFTGYRMTPEEGELARTLGVGVTLGRLAVKLNNRARAEFEASRKKTAAAKASRKKQGATA